MMDSHWLNLSPEEAKKAKEALEKALPMQRIGRPDDIAGAAIYLASEASNYTTGTEIIIDGALLVSSLSIVEGH
jgi:NAD(P)-dependent dehydrogenase (short-subunit alcohol dehydrogenase family)